MPLVDADTIIGLAGAYFVCSNGKIAYGVDRSIDHADIAKAEGLGESIEPSHGYRRMLVDDSGFMQQTADRNLFMFSNFSATCEHRDPKVARVNTLEIATRITGKRAIGSE